VAAWLSTEIVYLPAGSYASQYEPGPV